MKKKCLLMLVILGSICSTMQGVQGVAERLELEIYWGYSTLNPSDLNMAIDSEEALNHFMKNRYYDYLISIDYIRSFSMRRTGTYGKIKKALPFGFRLKFHLNSFFSLSLGAKYLQITKTSYPKDEFSIIELSGRSSLETVEYSPIMIRTKGLNFLLGAHFGTALGKRFRIEGYASGGPATGRFKYSFLQKNYLLYGDSGIEMDNEISQELEGKGRGTALEFGFQFSMNVHERVKVCIGAGYTFATIKQLSGSGMWNLFGEPEHWEGEIGIVSDPYNKPWGNKEFNFPSNDPFMLSYFKKRTMTLDQSGFILSLGLLFKLF